MSRFLSVLALALCSLAVYAKPVVLCGDPTDKAAFLRAKSQMQRLIEAGYIPTKNFSQTRKKTHVGTGLILVPGEKGVIVKNALLGSPAYSTGMFGRVAYRILAIDGDIALGKSMDEVTALIRGPMGTGVVLTLIRMNDGRTFERYLVRRVITRTVEIPCVSLAPPKK